ncbi:MAG: Bifunctional deaminase-reductase domain protein [Candidatus Moranbacteria bacterium GW2011_GWE1_49_15]|nr:MAG: Bifunctional deaminase-reductase domain protein [Candidatus Moranbacteria bacterium GW2011_GWE2_47_10]KKW07065.1 MAG: Bifunctional deaminase-reductase domain protein [Candidatus Moranbacteria bacterium GW2011_GWE1_49_15]HBP01417.1 hypothetical protein [Candidatus Moranbacteria bacterium]
MDLKNNMEISLFMAMSANGMVARENGEEDFLSDANWELYCGLARKAGAIIIGRKTYEDVKKYYNEYSFDDLTDVKKVILTRDKNFKIKGDYIIAHSPEDALDKLSALGVRESLVSGATVNTAFAKEGLLCNIVLAIEPVAIGKGISVFSKEEFDLDLSLESVKQEKDGRVILKYNAINKLMI